MTSAATPSLTIPSPWAGIAGIAAGPACIVCVVPFVWPVLAALGLGSAALISHWISWMAVPLLVLAVAVNAGRHGDRRPLRLVASGAIVYAVHVATHFGGGGAMLFMLSDYTSVALLGSGALLDLHRTLHVRHRVAATV